jgi:signal recognition particle GTPase
MKIKKILTENLKELLTEDVDEPEVTLDEINPNQASTSTIADAIQGSVEEITGDDTVADNVAAATAQEVKDVAQETGAGQVALDPTALPANIDEDEFVGCENILTKTLDKALRSARTAQKLKVRPDANVLVIGLPGSGKTSIVYD